MELVLPHPAVHLDPFFFYLLNFNNNVLVGILILLMKWVVASTQLNSFETCNNSGIYVSFRLFSAQITNSEGGIFPFYQLEEAVVSSQAGDDDARDHK